MVEEVTNKRRCVPPSEGIENLKKKLLESFEKIDKQITPEAIQTTVEKIHKRIADEIENRVFVRKPIKLFAEGEESARVSKKVEKLALSIQRTLGE